MVIGSISVDTADFSMVVIKMSYGKPFTIHTGQQVDNPAVSPVDIKNSKNSWSSFTVYDSIRHAFSFNSTATLKKIQSEKFRNENIRIISEKFVLTREQAKLIYSRVENKFSDKLIDFQKPDATVKSVEDQFFKLFPDIFAADSLVNTKQICLDILQKANASTISQTPLILTDDQIHTFELKISELKLELEGVRTTERAVELVNEVKKRENAINASKIASQEIASARVELQQAKIKAASLRGLRPKGNTGSTGSKILRAIKEISPKDFSLSAINVAIFKPFHQPKGILRRIEIAIKDFFGIFRPSKLQPVSSDPSTSFSPFIERMAAAFFTEFGGDGIGVIVPTELYQVDGEHGSIQVFERGKEAREYIDSIFKNREPDENELKIYQKFLILDYLLGNMDRHDRNWLIEVDETTQKIKRIIPIDNEKCLPIRHIERTWQYAAIDHNQYAPHRDLSWSNKPVSEDVKDWKNNRFSEGAIRTFFDRQAAELRAYCELQPDAESAKLLRDLEEFLKFKDQFVNLVLQHLKAVDQVINKVDQLNKLADLKTDEEISEYVSSSSGDVS